MNKQNLFYYLIRIVTLPFSFLPYKAIHKIGKILGVFCFYILTDYRKRTLSNLSLATDLNLSEKEIISTAKESFENLAINILEYPKLSREKDFSKIISCINPEKATEIYKSGKGIIFFCGHQANWELLFIDGNTRMKGTAIGKPIKNDRLYEWIISIREKTGGKIIIPQKALKESLRSLKKGEFIGIVGDQGMPSSNYCYPFFGRKSWNSTASALLSYKTNSPIIVATTKRENGKYFITYSDPILPNQNRPVEDEVIRLMDKSLSILENSIKEIPGQWLWQHNKWKQQTPTNLKKEFRHDSICLVLPDDESQYNYISKHLPTLRLIYPSEFILLFIPEKFRNNIKTNIASDIIFYKTEKDILINDYRCKLFFNFTKVKKIKRHFKKLSAYAVFTEQDLDDKIRKDTRKSAPKDLSDLFIMALTRSKNILKVTASK